ncbi:hypothetical protein ACFX1R_007029 [Malus domestica]
MHTVVARQISLAEWDKSCHGDGTLGQIIVPNVKGIERLSMNDVVRGLELVLQLHQKSIGSEVSLRCDINNNGTEEILETYEPKAATTSQQRKRV